MTFTRYRWLRVRRFLRYGGRIESGFTLIELLVVIIIIAILAAIAIPTFLGQRERANDTSAYTLVRNGLTALQTAYVDTQDYTKITIAMLNAIDPSMTWMDNGADLVQTAPPGISGAVAADASDHVVAVFLESPTVADIASRSTNGNWFGIQVDSLDVGDTGYIKVRLADGSAQLGW